MRQLKDVRFVHTCRPFLEPRWTAGKGRVVPVPDWGAQSTSQAACWRCPEFFQGRWGCSHPREGKMEPYKGPGVPTSEVVKLTFKPVSDSKAPSAIFCWNFLGRKAGRQEGAEEQSPPRPASTAAQPVCRAFSPFPGLSSNYHHRFRQLSKVFLVLAES